MRLNWRKWNRVLHRDLGFLFFGMTIVYAVSGIALNHLADWNPNYVVKQEAVNWQSMSSDKPDDLAVMQFLERHGEKGNYKTHYFPSSTRLKIFLKGGSIDIDLSTGEGVLEKLHRRPLFFHVNYLHYNPKRLWTWFSDIFCVSLFLIAVTGLFIIRGKTGITGRGAWLTGLGIVLPVLFLMLYL